MKTRQLAAGALVAVLLAVPATGAWAAHRAEALEAIARAKAAHAQARAAGAGTDTAALIEQAQALVPLRGYSRAIELAEQARVADERALAEATTPMPPPPTPVQPPAPAPAAMPVQPPAPAVPVATPMAPAAAAPVTAAAAPPLPVNTFSEAEAQAAIAAAEAARKQADAVGGEWRDTAQMIKDATALAKSGQYDAAVKLANQARQQGELGYAQALGQKGATFPSYVRHQP
jgi:hypothetical protein